MRLNFCCSQYMGFSSSCVLPNWHSARANVIRAIYIFRTKNPQLLSLDSKTSKLIDTKVFAIDFGDKISVDAKNHLNRSSGGATGAPSCIREIKRS
jgi:hypothetical protein